MLKTELTSDFAKTSIMIVRQSHSRTDLRRGVPSILLSLLLKMMKLFC